MGFRLLDMPWNVDEQYELLAFPFVEWSWLIQYRVGYRLLRPELEQAFRWVPYYEAGRYDAAILHLDLELVEPLDKAAARRRVYGELNASITDIPKVVIVHGARAASGGDPREVRDLIGDNYAVVSSDAVAERLGTGHVIAPAVIADDWLDLPKEPRVVTNLARATVAGLEIIERLRGELEARDIMMCRMGLDFVPATWAEYRDFLGRSLIYFAPPSYSERAKMEAMLSGCCVLAASPPGRAGGGDETDDGYVMAREPERLVELVEELITDPAGAVGAGRRARAACRRRYDWTRFSQQWLRCLETVINERPRKRLTG